MKCSRIKSEKPYDTCHFVTWLHCHFEDVLIFSSMIYILNLHWVNVPIISQKILLITILCHIRLQNLYSYIYKFQNLLFIIASVLLNCIHLWYSNTFRSLVTFPLNLRIITFTKYILIFVSRLLILYLLFSYCFIVPLYWYRDDDWWWF